MTPPHEQVLGPEADAGIADDRLRLIFTCWHPALSIEAQVALTLRTLAGLTTAEIGRAFLVPTETMAKRLVPAKHKIRQARIPHGLPPAHQLPGRTVAVLAVLYGLFDRATPPAAGRTSCGGPVHRRDPPGPAPRRAHARTSPRPRACSRSWSGTTRGARVDAQGDLVTSRTKTAVVRTARAIDEACTTLESGLGSAAPGPDQVMAAIAALHATAPSASATDWSEIATLYGELARMVPTPVVARNRAVAVAIADGPAAGLRLVADLEEDGRWVTTTCRAATRADLLRRLGDDGGAARGLPPSARSGRQQVRAPLSGPAPRGAGPSELSAEKIRPALSIGTPTRSSLKGRGLRAPTRHTRTRHAHLPPRRSPPEDAAAPAASALEASDASFSALGAHLDDAGNPVFARSALGTCGPGTVLAGSSMVTVDDGRTARCSSTAAASRSARSRSSSGPTPRAPAEPHPPRTLAAAPGALSAPRPAASERNRCRKPQHPAPVSRPRRGGRAQSGWLVARADIRRPRRPPGRPASGPVAARSGGGRDHRAIQRPARRRLRAGSAAFGPHGRSV